MSGIEFSRVWIWVILVTIDWGLVLAILENKEYRDEKRLLVRPVGFTAWAVKAALVTMVLLLSPPLFDYADAGSFLMLAAFLNFFGSVIYDFFLIDLNAASNTYLSAAELRSAERISCMIIVLFFSMFLPSFLWGYSMESQVTGEVCAASADKDVRLIFPTAVTKSEGTDTPTWEISSVETGQIFKLPTDPRYNGMLEDLADRAPLERRRRNLLRVTVSPHARVGRKVSAVALSRAVDNPQQVIEVWDAAFVQPL